MADIKTRINNIKHFFRGMQVEDIDGEQIIYVIVNFPPRWIIPDDVEAKYNITVEQGENVGDWFFIAEFSVGFDAVFDAIEYTINIMKTAQERVNLLQKKVEALRNIFEDESMTIEMLRTLEFTWKGKKKVPTMKQKKQEQIEDKQEDNEDGA